jgi:hypothetical protein
MYNQFQILNLINLIKFVKGVQRKGILQNGHHDSKCEPP